MCHFSHLKCRQLLRVCGPVSGSSQQGEFLGKTPSMSILLVLKFKPLLGNVVIRHE